MKSLACLGLVGLATACVTSDPVARDTASGGQSSEPAMRGTIPLDDLSDASVSWFGEPRCEDSVLLVCESFEETSSPALPAGWTRVSGFGSSQLGVSSERAARGQGSVRIDIAAGQTSVSALVQRSNLGELGPRHFGRQFVYIEGPGTQEFVHFDVLAVNGPYQGSNHQVRLAATGTSFGDTRNHLSFIYNVQPSPGAEFGTEAERSGHPVVDAWMCLEWFFDAEVQQARFWYDGVELEYLHIDEERSEIPVLTAVNVGLQKFQPTEAWTVYIDEVALNDERIGCNN